MHLGVDELAEAEVVCAYTLLQQRGDLTPEAIMSQVRPGACLLNPDEFARDIQRRYQELIVAGRSESRSGE
jgi:hypothetical protein